VKIDRSRLGTYGILEIVSYMTHATTSISANSKSKANASGGALGIKETLTSLIIAFILAFLFRGFVIEGFQIPTGSMAPTLMGKHVRFVSPYNGYDWSVGPWTYAPRSPVPMRQQMNMKVKDPMSALTITDTNRRLAAGDRVFVLKYLPFLHQPERWDVVVFKNPGTHENYIKRLVGLPGEQVAIVDGDVFTRPFVDGQTSVSGWDAWAESGWDIARKSERIQRTMFLDVYDSRYVPMPMDPGFRSPFTGMTPGWEGVETNAKYRYTGSSSTALAWNTNREITDANAYNQTSERFDLFARSDDKNIRLRPFPVSDVAVTLNIEANEEPVQISAVLEARGMEFRGVVDSAAGKARVEMRAATTADSDWTTLDEGSFSAFEVGEIYHIEFWHVDQALWLFLGDKLVCGGTERGAYQLSPAQRAMAATGMSLEELAEDRVLGDGVRNLGVFARTDIYRKPTFRWTFSGGPFTVHNVTVQRDIAYQINRGRPTRGGHPDFFPTLNGDEFFMCGDNSSNSADSRLWLPNEINKWVHQEIDNRPGMVHRDLIVGKAFMVYFPALLDDGPVLTPDMGRMRWIW